VQKEEGISLGSKSGYVQPQRFSLSFSIAGLYSLGDRTVRWKSRLWPKYHLSAINLRVHSISARVLAVILDLIPEISFALKSLSGAGRDPKRGRSRLIFEYTDIRSIEYQIIARATHYGTISYESVPPLRRSILSSFLFRGIELRIDTISPNRRSKSSRKSPRD